MVGTESPGGGGERVVKEEEREAYDIMVIPWVPEMQRRGGVEEVM
jgi:hypothetical protein